jgi:hypothetical protein
MLRRLGTLGDHALQLQQRVGGGFAAEETEQQQRQDAGSGASGVILFVVPFISLAEVGH